MDILESLKQLRDDIKIWVTNNLNALNAKIDEKTIPIDNELDLTSTNPVQNKAIANAINNIPRFSGDYNDLTNAPDITEDESGNMVIADESGNIIFKADADGMHTTALSLNGEPVATESYVNEVVANIDIPGTDLTGYATEEYVTNAVNSIEIPEVDFTGYATESYVNEAVANIDIPDVDFTGYATENFVSDAVESAKNELSESITSESEEWKIVDEAGNIIFSVDASGAHTTSMSLNGDFVATEKWVENKNYLTGHQDISGKSDVGHKHILEDITDLPNYATETYVDNKVADLVNSAPEALDTLGELAAALENHEDAYDALLETVGSKATSEDLNNLKTELSESIVAESEEWKVVDEAGNIIFSVDATGAHTTALTLNGESVEDIIPDISKKPGEIVAGKSYTIGEETVTAGQGAEVFNSYTNNKASGNYSHAEGYYTTASGDYSHAEGYYTTASGKYSHAEGRNTTASGESSHAEGYHTTASGDYSHAEGRNTTASGNYSHAEGNRTTASGDYSHAEGYETIASCSNSHVQGRNNIEDTANKYAHIVGNGTSSTSRSNAHTIDWQGNAWFKGDVFVGSTSGTNKDDGSKKLATETYVNNQMSSLVNSAPEKLNTLDKLAKALNNDENFSTTITNSISKKPGEIVAGKSYTIGEETVIASYGAEVFNNYQYNKATGSSSHAEGYYTTASGDSSHAEGYRATASGNYSHAEGCYTTASGDSSHAEGYRAAASGNYSHAEGYYTTARGDYSHVQGRYNKIDSQNKYVHIVGNGESNKYSNAHTLDWNGNAWFAGNIYIGGTGQDDTAAIKVAIVPFPTAADEGKFLRVVNGIPTWVSIPNAEEATF